MKFLFFILIIPKIIFDQQDSLFYKMSASDFMKLPEVNKPIDARNPNPALLDAALFHLTNVERIKFNLPVFIYSHQIHKAAIEHTESMIDRNFYGHENPNSPAHKTLSDRIFLQTMEFKEMAENIAQHDILGGTENIYCFKIPKNGQDYIFLNCESKKPILTFTYAELAKSVVNGWMNSQHHRENILNPRLKSMACAGRFSNNPYKTQKSTYARLTQDFGG